MYAHMFRDGSCVLDACNGNKTQTAKPLDIDDKTLLAKLKTYGIATDHRE